MQLASAEQGRRELVTNMCRSRRLRSSNDTPKVANDTPTGVVNTSLTFRRRSRRLHSSRVRSDLEIPTNLSTVLLDVEKEKLIGDENTFTYENIIWGRHTMHTHSTVHTAKSNRQEEMNQCMFGSHVPPSHPSSRTTFFRAYGTSHSPTGKLCGRGLSQRQREGKKEEEQGDEEAAAGRRGEEEEER